MQDEVNEKTIALYIKTGKLTAQTLQKAMKAILSKGKKQLTKQPQGKQSLKQLMKQNAGVSNIEITEGNIKAFESTAKKYGIDFALKKDATESPPRYLVFFKGRDADVLTAAFKEFSAKKLTQEKKPSIRKLLSTLKEAAQGKNAERAKVKNKDREVLAGKGSGTPPLCNGVCHAPGAYPATMTAWQTAGGQGKLHFPYAALRQLPLCELAGSEHLAMQAIHFPQV